MVVARAVFSGALVLACAGCAIHPVVSESNYLTFEHPFTDAAAEAVRKSAVRQCAERKQVAVKTTSTCSLARCTTNYQCMSNADAAPYLR